MIGIDPSLFSLVTRSLNGYEEMNIQKTTILAAVLGVGVMAAGGCQSGSDKLFTAIRAKDVGSVKELLAAGDIDLDPRSAPYKVNKPLAYAAAYGNLDIVQLLVNAGADLNGQVAYGDVALIKADEHGNDDIIEFLIKAGADVNVPNAFGVTPFIGMCGQGRLGLVLLATEHGGDANASFEAKTGKGAGTKNFSPLQAAVAYGHKEVVEFLLSEGADPKAKDYKGRSSIEIAEFEKHEAIAQFLRDQLKLTKDGGG